MTDAEAMNSDRISHRITKSSELNRSGSGPFGPASAGTILALIPHERLAGHPGHDAGSMCTRRRSPVQDATAPK